jgi:hypothetical protein
MIIGLRNATKGRRWAPLIAAAGLLALLSGCVVYPVGYGPHPHYYYR